MSNYQFTPQAVEDLFEIWSYIANDDSEAASRVEDAIYAACAFLADTPLAGRIREDLTALPLRFWLVRPYRNYWIVYHAETKPLQVIRILHAARNIPQILR
jgi:plasmid stabilization system protein ParE